MSSVVDSKLAKVIAHVESNDRQFAIRFEDQLYASHSFPTELLNSIHLSCGCSLATARMVACTSWGRYQILGENIYSVCQYNKTPVEFCEDSAAQDAALALFLSNRRINFPLEQIMDSLPTRAQFILHYNGPGNQVAYWRQMLSWIKYYGFDIGRTTSEEV